MSGLLVGRVVIVTGGGRGVGRGISERFLEAGAEVVICSRSEPEKLPEAGGRTALFTAADVRDIDQIDRVVAFTRASRFSTKASRASCESGDV